jgi:hypothetical protein
MSETTPAGTLSPDGRYKWDGSAWLPVDAASPVPGATQAPVVQKIGHRRRNLGLGCLGLIVLFVIYAVASGAGKSTSTTSTGPSPSPHASASLAETRMTAQQKASLQKVMTDEMNHYNALFTGGKAAWNGEVPGRQCWIGCIQ